jgi:CRISPR type III-associated protein (TIGR04423 family)
MEIKKIQGTATGYVWKSNATLPEVYIDKPIDLDLSAPGIPFVVEANLVIDRKSYSVKMVDGAYRVTESSLESTEKGKLCRSSCPLRRFLWALFYKERRISHVESSI